MDVVYYRLGKILPGPVWVGAFVAIRGQSGFYRVDKIHGPRAHLRAINLRQLDGNWRHLHELYPVQLVCFQKG